MTAHSLDLYWIPLGSGGHCVRMSGRVYEAAHAVVGRRRATDLFHAALVVRVDGTESAIEVAPVWDHDASAVDRGVTVTGPVGLRVLGRWPLFRYEVRCWPGGTIPDLADAVGGPQQLASDGPTCRAVLDAATEVPVHTWGRDEQGLGEMWNSNSVAAWLLVRAGVAADDVVMPSGGSAPGWGAGVRAAQIQLGNHIRQCHCS